MIFNSNNNFKHHKLHNGDLWLAGKCNIDTEVLSKLFSDHEVPECKGNFAIVWIGNDNWSFVQSDHLNT